jgi:CDP-diacylglycerol--glycerol-3-phosphate 3-phosphatidyltransferase
MLKNGIPTLPTFLTIARIILIPLIMISYYADFFLHNVVAMLLLTTAGVTDWLDGHLARKNAQTSKFGAFLDPVADKLLVTVLLVMLGAHYPSLWYVVPACLIVAREVMISALREWMAERQLRDVVAVGAIGKVKTTFQMIAIGALLMTDHNGWTPFWLLGYVCLFVAAALTVWSFCNYLWQARTELLESFH